MVELYAATGDGLARIIQQDGEWGCKLVLDRTGVQCLVLDPQDQNLLFAGSRGHGVFRSRDGGESWDSLQLPERDIFSLAISAADGAVYAGSEPSRLFVSRDRGESWRELEALRQIPSAPTWSFPPRPWTSHVRWIAPSPHEADLLLVGIELGGLMLSEDGGASWSDHRPGAQKDVHTLAWHPEVPGGVYEAGGGGAAWSRDGGRTWEAADAGRDRHYTWGLAVDPQDADCWYISANPGPSQAHSPEADAQALIYRWRGAGPWQVVGDGILQPFASFIYALAVIPGWLFAGLGDGRLYASNNAGEKWHQLPISGDPITSIHALAVRTGENGD